MKAGEKDLYLETSNLRLFAKALEQNRLAHAYLVTGPAGSGKKRFMEDCAKFLLCVSPISEPNPQPCLQCKSCRKFERGVHPDLLILEPHGRYIKIDQVRDMQKMLSFAPLEAKRRICTIISADSLNKDAANALLKTLEEPPENTHLLLSAISTSRLLPTIVSRCQLLPLKGYAHEHVFDELFTEDTLPRDELPFLRYVSGGNPELARQMVEAGLCQTRQTIFSFLSSEKKMELFFSTSKAISSTKDSLEIAIKILQLVVRDLYLMGKAGQAAQHLLVNQDKIKELTKLAQIINYDSLFGYRISLENAQRYLDRNVNPEMISDKLLIFWLKAENQGLL